MNTFLWSLLVLATALPVGWWIAWLARDELRAGKLWFVLVSALGVIGALVCTLTRQPAYALMLLYVAVLALIALWKSADRHWTGERKA